MYHREIEGQNQSVTTLEPSEAIQGAELGEVSRSGSRAARLENAGAKRSPRVRYTLMAP
jgi:hypothetical protein